MKRITSAFIIGMMGMGGLAGCRDNTPPPPRVPVPTSDNRDVVGYRRPEPAKPLPSPRPQDSYVPAPYDDAPLVSQQTPEQPAFVGAYRGVGSPRIVVFVNRTLDGNIIPVTSGSAVDRQTSNGSYLHAGQYDELKAGTVDYEAIELALTDWIGCNGQVTIISPTMARQRFTDEQVRDLQQGRPQIMSDIVQQLGADILIQAQARPTKQTSRGLDVRMVAEALNVKGGQRLASAWVDVPSPLEKTTVSQNTRVLARQLMDGMINAWAAPLPAPQPQGANAPAPTTQP